MEENNRYFLVEINFWTNRTGRPLTTHFQKITKAHGALWKQFADIWAHTETEANPEKSHLITVKECELVLRTAKVSLTRPEWLEFYRILR